MQSIRSVLMSNTKDETTHYFTTGCTLLDLVLGGGHGMGFPAGKILNIIGDKSAGKSFISAEMVAANAHHDKKFVWNYDDSESGFSFDTQSIYGMSIIDKDTLRSTRIEEMDVNVTRFLKRIAPSKKHGMYIIDSLDGLSNNEKATRTEARFKHAEKGEVYDDGTYGTKTPKFLSQEFFPNQAPLFETHGVALVIVSQVREKLDGTVQKYTRYENRFSRSGGKAIDFYAHTVLWLRNLTKIEIEVDNGGVKEKRVVGVVINAWTSKSKTARPYRSCTFTVLFDYGVDNIGSNVDYLFNLRGDSGQLTAAAKSVAWEGKACSFDDMKQFLRDTEMYDACRDAKKAQEGTGRLDFSFVRTYIDADAELSKKFNATYGTPYTREELIAKIEDSPEMQAELEQRVIAKWNEIEAQVASNRKSKY